MQLRADSDSAGSPPSEGDGVPGEEGSSVLAARVDELESIVRTATELIDPKALKELRRTIEAFAKRDPKFEERVTQRVAVLADRVETVAKTVSTSSSALAAKDGEIAQLRRELDAKLGRIDASIVGAARGADPAELAEIRRALDVVSKASNQRTPRGLEGRLDELAAKFALASERLDSVSSTVSTTAAGLAGREGDMNALRRAFEAGSDRVDAELAELRQALDPRAIADLREELKRLADETGRRLHSTRQAVGQVATKVDGHEDQLGSLATSESSTSTRIAVDEQNISALHAYVKESAAHVKSVLGQQHESLTTLAARAEALEQSDAQAAQSADERISAANEKIDDLAGRLDPLVAAVASTSERLAAKDDDLQAMERRLEEASSRVDGLVSDLSQALAEFPDPNRVEEALVRRIEELAGQTASLADRVTQVQASTSASSTDLERFVADARATTGDLSERIDMLAGSMSATVERVSGADEQLSALRTHVDVAGERLEALVADQKELLVTIAARTTSLEQAEGQGAEALEQRVAELGRRLDGLAGLLESLAASMTSTAGTVASNEEAVSELRAYVEDAGGRLSSLVEGHKTSLAEHMQELAALTARTASREEGESARIRILDERGSEAEAALSALSQRVETFAGTLASAVTSLDDKELELAEQHRRFTHSSARIETVVEDIRDTLAALPDASPDALDEMGSTVASNAATTAALAGRLERLEAVQLEHVAAQLGERFDRLESRIAAVAAEMGRAKTLWPVALRSLEARLDDLVARSRDPDATTGDEPSPGAAEDGPLELLAGLRDSLQAMESVAEEVSRASDAWASEDEHSGPPDPSPSDAPAAATGGARVVPLRATEP